MAEEKRQVLRRRYDFRCGYCGVREADVGAELTLDHFQPRSQGGKNDIENLVYCCRACNVFKSGYWNPDAEERILHPLRDNVAEQFAEDAKGRLRSLTPTGAFHIERLQLNRRELVAYRRERRLLNAANARRQALLSRLPKLERRVERLHTRISELAPKPDADGIQYKQQ